MDIWEDIRSELRKHSTTYEYLNNVSEIIKRYPNFDVDALSKGQLYSKLWMVSRLKKILKNLGVVYLYCGWYSILAEMLFNNFQVEKIKSFDLDKSCEPIADELNIQYVMDSWRFKAFTENINKVNCSEANTVINLSCEHMNSNKWFHKIPANSLVILKSNNFEAIPDHINCDKSIDDMIEKYPLFKIYDMDVLDLKDYTRFMVIGTK